MLCRPAQRLLCANRSYAALSVVACSSGTNQSNLSNAKKPIRVIDDRAQQLLESEASSLPMSLIRTKTYLQRKFTKSNLDPAIRSLIDGAAAQLYYNCANDYNFEELRELFGLPDHMSTWFKLTLMHVWMVLFRMHTSMDAVAYERLLTSLLSTMWLDVDQRLKIVSEEIKVTLTSENDMKRMHGLHLYTFFEYDEGFIVGDAMLAAAIWRCLYIGRQFDPVQVLRVVTYMRSTVAWLDTLEVDSILTDGIKDWKRLKSQIDDS